MNRGQSYLRGTAICAATLIGFGAVAQEGGGIRATFGVNQSIESSDNFNFDAPGSEESGTRAVTNLRFGLSSRTENTQLSLTTTGQFEAGTGAETGLSDPTARLAFRTGNRSTQIRLQGNYAESDVSNAGFTSTQELTGTDALLQAFGFAPTEPEQLFLGDGTRIRTGAGIDLDLWRDAPISLSLSADYSHTGYRDALDPSLFEFDNLTTRASTRLRLSPVANLSFGASLVTYSAQNALRTERTNATYFSELSYQVRSDLTASASLNYADNETRNLLTTDVNKGLGGGLGLTKTMQRGTLGLRFDSSINSDGRRDTLRLNRSLDLRDGTLAVSLGLLDTEQSGPEPLVSATYTKNLKRGQMQLGLSQQAGVNSDDETIVNTRLRAGYDMDINPVSGIGVSLSLADTKNLQNTDDTRRLNLGLSYRHALSRDWNMVARYSHATSNQTAQADRSSSTVTLGVQRAFEFRP